MSSTPRHIQAIAAAKDRVDYLYASSSESEGDDGVVGCRGGTASQSAGGARMPEDAVDELQSYSDSDSDGHDADHDPIVSEDDEDSDDNKAVSDGEQSSLSDADPFSEDRHSQHDDDDDDDDEEYEEKWSVRVRLISTVDLPPSLRPLCPLFKFGLVSSKRRLAHDSPDAAADAASVPDPRALNHDSHPSSVLAQPQQSALSAERAAQHSKHGTLAAQLTTHGLLSLPRSRAKSSSSKILSARDSGSMQWHEEFRWDGIASPLDTVLAVELCARAPVPPTLTKGGHAFALHDKPEMLRRDSESSRDGSEPMAANHDNPTRPGLGTNVPPVPSHQREVFGAKTKFGFQSYVASTGSCNDDSSATSPSNSIHGCIPSTGSASNSVQEQDEGQTMGILGLWRKGRQSLEQRNRRLKGTQGGAREKSEMEAALAASTVARFIMDKQAKHEPQKVSLMKTGPPSMITRTSSAPVQKNFWNSALAGSENDPLAGAFDDMLPGSAWSRRKRDTSTIDVKQGTPVLHQELPTPLFSQHEQGELDSGGAQNDTHFNNNNDDHNNDDHNNDDNDEEELLELPQATYIATKKRKTGGLVDDLRLGTLTIPLSQLPLEEERPMVEKWYQIDTTNQVYGGSDAKTRKVAKKALSPRRCPSVLLEISFCNANILDESEDDADEGDDGGDITWDHGKAGGNDVNKNVKSDFSNIDHDSSKPYTTFASGNRSSRRLGSGAIPIGVAAVSSIDDAQVSKKEREAAAQLQEAQSLITNGPNLEPGIVDFVCMVGARDIGNQKNDDGSKGWVQSTPECCILEQFPPDDTYHAKNGRKVTLANKIEWFCFPEGCRLWRGAEPPTHMDMNLKRFSASSPPTMASSIAAFDACLNCTTSFTWFVMSSNSDEYGSRIRKTYGAVIRFYVPAPPGIDSTQDDYAQAFAFQAGGAEPVVIKSKRDRENSAKRLWVPLGICMTTTIPIVGILEAMLLRLCEKLASRANVSNPDWVTCSIHTDIANLIVNFQAPIPGVVNCSIPFLSGDGDRLLVTLPPWSGLPALPYGAAVTSVCRLLGAEGLTVMLAAVLTECKILIHSADVANLAMVAEVMTALIYPFTWQLPYIPVLPEAMLEFVEAPLSYFLGVPSCNMKWIDKTAMLDVVVIDLDNGFASPDYFDGRRGSRGSKMPTPLPSSVSNNISKAVFRLLREEEEVEQQFGSSTFSGARHLPRLEGESLAEREFRVAVAQQICGLIRGYQECLFFVSASQPVFNRDRFLRNAPALFEDRRGTLAILASTQGVAGHGGSTVGSPSQRILSPRSKRFLSNLVNTQHFHALLEKLDVEDVAFFHEVMDTFERTDEQSDNINTGTANAYGPSQQEEAARRLSAALEKVEQKIPTYHVNRTGKRILQDSDFDDDDDLMQDLDDDDDILGYDMDDGSYMSSFTNELLQPVVIGSFPQRRGSDSSGSAEGVHSLSLQHLVELEKNPWRYCHLFDIPIESAEENRTASNAISEAWLEGCRSRRRLRQSLASSVNSDDKLPKPVVVKVWPKVKLREALGERKFRSWKLAQEKKSLSTDDNVRLSARDFELDEGNNVIDLASLLSSVTDDLSMETSGFRTGVSKFTLGVSLEQQQANDARNRDVLRRCLERAYEGAQNRSTRHPLQSLEAGAMSSASNDFKENGIDMVAEAEAALRNPSAQRFLVSVLSQRTRLENQRRRRQGQDDGVMGARHRQNNQSSVSRLQPNAFECLVRLCYAMLEACIEEQDYEAAYRLLTHTAGFCTVNNSPGPQPITSESTDSNVKIIYMTARIGMHPIFADLRLWERVLLLHQQDRQKDKNSFSLTSSGSGRSTPTENRQEDNADADEYEAAVSTLYEMLGYGVPAEDLAKFATRIAEEREWFSTERGQKLLMLARRLSVKRDEGDFDATRGAGELDLMGTVTGTDAEVASTTEHVLHYDGNTADLDGDLGTMDIERSPMEWEEIAWSHPVVSIHRLRSASGSSYEADTSAAQSRRKAGSSGRGAAGGATSAYNSLLVNMRNLNSRGGTQGHPVGRDQYGSRLPPIPPTLPTRPRSAVSSADEDGVLDAVGYTGRTPVTSMASFGTSVVVSGGLDGSVFMAHTIGFDDGDDSSELYSKDVGSKPKRTPNKFVNGVRLEWGSSSRKEQKSSSQSGFTEGEFGVGAVSCLAAAKGAGNRQGTTALPEPVNCADDEELLAAMQGCHIVAGTTGGDLRVWSVKDVYASSMILKDGGMDSSTAADVAATSLANMRNHHGHSGEGPSSTFVLGGGRVLERQASISSRTRHPFRGRALTGHRGGVTCIDVPSHVYRPDSLVSGGADGLIKVWSLRSPSNRRPSKTSNTGGASGRPSLISQGSSRGLFARDSSSRSLMGGSESGGSRSKSSSGSDAQDVLTGHGGRVLCVKTAWHGDRLLSGGADKTLRLWDLASSGGKCLHTLHGHLGWVTKAHYWGPHTLVSGSTDRSIALWDARAGASPLFVLRYHRAPVSDLLVGSRTEFFMVSAGGDGAVATWDFRRLSGQGGRDLTPPDTQSGRQGLPTKTVRDPIATMNHCQEGKGVKCSGFVHISRGAGMHRRSVLSVSVDGKIKEWDIASGRLLAQKSTGHSDVVSSISTYVESDGLRRGHGAVNGGIITSSWDGTIRLRRLVHQQSTEKHTSAAPATSSGNA